MQILIIDNYDSFTYNLYQLFAGRTDQPPLVVKNDTISYAEILALNPDAIVISPGPGRPEYRSDMGVSQKILQSWSKPLLGVCLGHQGLAATFGGSIQHAVEPMHGRISQVRHQGDLMFAQIPATFEVVRYHSLVVAEPLPQTLIPTAWAEDGALMALRHKIRPMWGVQYHPESIRTEFGARLIDNFLQMARDFSAHRPYQLTWEQLDIFPDPEQVYQACYLRQEHTYWLDSCAQTADQGQYSYMGAWGEGPADLLLAYGQQQEQLVVNGETIDRSLFPYLQEIQPQYRVVPNRLPIPFQGGWVGQFHYEGDARLIFSTRLIAWDHFRQQCYLLALHSPKDAMEARAWISQRKAELSQLGQGISPALPHSSGPVSFSMSQDEAGYLQRIQICQEEIREGESYEICLTNQFHTEARPDPWTLYQRLRAGNPAPYAALFRWGESWVMSSSPEQFLQIDSSGKVQTKPIKGTIHRSADPLVDQQLKAQLQQSEKDQAENLMIVDLLRNDLGKVSKIGSVQVPTLMQVETFATVHQLVSTVESQLAEGKDAIDCLEATFPGGSITGAPKQRTMEILSRLEARKRGVYTGSMGFLSVNGAAHLNIAIRTLQYDETGITFGSGGAITYLSDPEAEFKEILLKAFPLIRAIVEAATQGTFDPDRVHIAGINPQKWWNTVLPHRKAPI